MHPICHLYCEVSQVILRMQVTIFLDEVNEWARCLHGLLWIQVFPVDLQSSDWLTEGLRALIWVPVSSSHPHHCQGWWQQQWPGLAVSHWVLSAWSLVCHFSLNFQVSLVCSCSVSSCLHPLSLACRKTAIFQENLTQKSGFILTTHIMGTCGRLDVSTDLRDHHLQCGCNTYSTSFPASAQ
jgi:hypothetical protein